MSNYGRERVLLIKVFKSWDGNFNGTDNWIGLRQCRDFHWGFFSFSDSTRTQNLAFRGIFNILFGFEEYSLAIAASRYCLLILCFRVWAEMGGIMSLNGWEPPIAVRVARKEAMVGSDESDGLF